MPFTTIIFDFGGVITDSPFDRFSQLEDARGFPKDFIRRVNATNPDTNAWAQFERAEIDESEFDILFAEEARLLGHHLHGALVLECLAVAVRLRMVAALDHLKGAGFALGCITNNMKAGQGAGMSRSADQARNIADAMTRFDHIIESSVAGVRKPDPRIYQMMCEVLGVSPSECIYLDDLGINCKPAATLGMHAIKVAGEDQALHDLGLALGMNFA